MSSTEKKTPGFGRGFLFAGSCGGRLYLAEAGRLLTAADLATAWVGRCWPVRWVLQEGCRNLRKQKYPEMPKLWWAIEKAAINHEAISFMSERRMPMTSTVIETRP